jgi:hypothetical protein
MLIDAGGPNGSPEETGVSVLYLYFAIGRCAAREFLTISGSSTSARQGDLDRIHSSWAAGVVRAHQDHVYAASRPQPLASRTRISSPTRPPSCSVLTHRAATHGGRRPCSFQRQATCSGTGDASVGKNSLIINNPDLMLRKSILTKNDAITQHK